MKILQGIFGAIFIIGCIGTNLLFVYVYWVHTRGSFIGMPNTLVFLSVTVTLLTMPIFWISLVMAIVGYGVVQKLEDN